MSTTRLSGSIDVISRLCYRRLLWMAGVTVVALVSAGPIRADDEQQVPEPETVLLETKDQVKLVCTYYAGTKAKETVPIIMVNGWGGVRGEFAGLARSLQQRFGHAVIVLDSRGHGESVRRVDLNGTDRAITPDRMNREQISGMYKYDVEAVKKFLVEEHNKGNLNIELLCIVGSEMGTIVAMNWAVQDWSWPQLVALKQGQDIKVFVLVSPVQAFKGLKLQPALQHPDVRSLSTLIIVGQEDRHAYTDALRLKNQLKRFHPLVLRDPQEAAQSLSFVAFDTSLQGTDLLNARVRSRGYSPYDWVGGFIQSRLTGKEDEYPWKDRSR